MKSVIVSRAAPLLAMSTLLASNPRAEAGMTLQAMSLNILLAQAAPAGLAQGFGFVLTLVTVIGFVMGVIMVIQGWRSIDRGDEGKLKILGGVGTALAVPIMKWIYGVVLPGTVDGLVPGALT